MHKTEHTNRVQTVGSGVFNDIQYTPFGISQTSRVCEECGGNGKIFNANCTSCNNKDVKLQSDILNVNLSDFTNLYENGSRTIVNGYGNEKIDGINCDLVVNIAHKDFGKYEIVHVFNKSILLYHMDLNPIEVMCGCKKEIILPNDSKIQVTIPKCSKDKKQFNVANNGLMNLSTNQRDNLIVVIDTVWPSSISDTSIDKLKEIEL